MGYGTTPNEWLAEELGDLISAQRVGSLAQHIQNLARVLTVEALYES